MIQSKQPPLISGARFFVIVVITIAIFLIIDFGRRATTSYYVAQAEKELQAEIQAELTRQAHLQERLTYVRSDEYVEKWAREEAHMVHPGDQPLILVTVEAPVAPGRAPTDPAHAAPAVEPAWHAWWRLFFDTKPISLP